MKNKYIFGGIIIAVFLILMGYLFTQSNIEYVDDFGKVIASVWNDTAPKFRPVILLVTEDIIKRKNKELYLKRKKNPSIKK